MTMEEYSELLKEIFRKKIFENPIHPASVSQDPNFKVPKEI